MLPPSIEADRAASSAQSWHRSPAIESELGQKNRFLLHAKQIVRMLREASNPGTRIRARGAGRAAYAHSAPIAVPPAVMRLIESASDSWLELCLSRPLVHGQTGTRVHLFGVAPFAPPSAAAVLRAVRESGASAVVLDLPLPTAASGQLRAYPSFIDALLDSFEGNDLQTATASLSPQESEGLAAALGGCRSEAQVGRDVLDPYECFG